MQTFMLGDEVKWVSSASGTTKNKEGEVVYVVKEGRKRPTSKWLELMFQASAVPIDGVWPRDHESYIVRVRGNTSKQKAKLYWPRVSKLEKTTRTVKE